MIRRPKLSVPACVVASLLACAPLISAAEDVPARWLAFLPKAERAKAVALVESMDRLRAGLSQDRVGAQEAELAYGLKASVLAADLDRRSAAGLSLPSEGDLKELGKLRLLRWESARDIAEYRYGGASASGNAAARLKELARNGRSLAALLEPRLARVPKRELAAAASALAERMTAHPDCPASALASLRSAAEALDGALLRSWLLLLAAGDPAAVAAEEIAGDGQTEALALYFAARRNFTEAYRAGMLLRDAGPAAAALAWYVDGPALGQPPLPQVSASVESFARNLAALEGADLRRALSDERQARAFAEAATLLWVGYTRIPAAFVAALRIDEGVLSSALTALLRALPVLALEEPVVAPGNDALDPGLQAPGAYSLTLDAVRELDSLSAAAPLSSWALLDSFLSFKEQGGDPRIPASGFRYAAFRERLYDAAHSSAEEVRAELEAHYRSLVPAGTRVELGLLVASELPAGPFVLAAQLFRYGADGSLTIAPVAPSALAGAFDKGRSLIDAGLLVPTLPALLESRPMDGREMAALLLGKPFPCKDGDAWTYRAVSLLCGRYGVPVALAAVTRDDAYGVLVRYALLSSGAFRLAGAAELRRGLKGGSGGVQ